MNSVLPNGFILSYDTCNTVTPVSYVLTTNDDYSVTFDVEMPATTPIYTLAWYTCQGWGNPANIGQTVTTPNLSKATITINAPNSSVFQTITVTNPEDLSLNEEGHWIYTTNSCQFNVDGLYQVHCTLEWDYDSAPQTSNPWHCYSSFSYGTDFQGRPPIGQTFSNADYVEGTVLPYHSAAGCNLVKAPNPKKRR